jgi:hypothetical protein
MTVVLSVEAVGEFRTRAPPFWMTGVSRWYDQALGALMYAIVTGACVVYLLRTKGLEPWHVRGLAARPVPWRKKVELRIVLYCLATGLILQLPMGIVAAARAAHDFPPPGGRSFISLLSADGWIFPLVGVAIIIYDRRRLKRDHLYQRGVCHTCGYDLTGNTSGVCPECGTPVEGKQEASA